MVSSKHMIQAKKFGSIAKYGFYTLVVELKRYVSTSFILQIREILYWSHKLNFWKSKSE